MKGEVTRNDDCLMEIGVNVNNKLKLTALRSACEVRIGN